METVGPWRIVEEKPPTWWRWYHCVAEAEEAGESFRLECAFERPLMLLTISVAGSEEPLFLRILDCQNRDNPLIVRRVLRIARRDIRRNLERLERLLVDMALEARHTRWRADQTDG